MKNQPEKENYQIRSVDRAITILELFRNFSPLTLAEITKKSGLPKSTVFNILAVLEKREFITEDKSGNYVIGAGALRIGWEFLRRRESLVAIAKPYLEKLVECFPGSRAHLSILANHNVLYLDVIESGFMYTNVGNVDPSYSSASGKVLLAEESEEKLKEYLEKTNFTAKTPFTITNPQKLRENLRQVREKGYAASDEENRLGFISFAAAIRGHDGGGIAAVSLRAVKSVLTESDKAEIVNTVCQAARQISLRLGYQD